MTNGENTAWMTEETIKAIAFMGNQLSKGWTVEEVFSQITGSYGMAIRDMVVLSLQRTL